MRTRAITAAAAASLLGALALGIPAGSSGAGSTPLGPGTGQWGLDVADFNGDGKPDVVASTGSGDSVRILINNLGTTATTGDTLAKKWASDKAYPFLIPGTPALGGNVTSDVKAVDLNNDVNADNPDGRPEIVLPGAGDDAVTVLSLTANTNLDSASKDLTLTRISRTVLKHRTDGAFLTGAVPVAVGTGDFNRDGCMDAATADTASREFGVLMGIGPRFDSGSPKPASFFDQLPAPFPATFQIPNGIVVADFNADGKLDMASANSGDRTVTIQINQGNSAPKDTDFAKGCGKTDKTLPVDNVKSFPNPSDKKHPTPNPNWNPGFGVPKFKAYVTGAGFSPINIAGADFDGNKATDLVTASTLDGITYVIFSNPDKKKKPIFQATKPINLGSCADGPYLPHNFATGDWDGDGKPDLAISTPACDSVLLLKNLGKKKFSAPYKIPLSPGSGPLNIKLADLNADRKADLIVSDSEGEHLTVLISKGIPNPKLATGLAYDLIETGSLVNAGPKLSSAAGALPTFTDGTTDCATPGAPSPCGPQSGDGLDVSDPPGVWLGAADADNLGSPYTYRIQWQRRTSGVWDDINGATAVHYDVTSADVGHELRACVWAKSGQTGARIESTPACTAASLKAV